MHGILIEEARDATDEILSHILKRGGDASVLTTRGLTQRTRRLYRALRRAIAAEEHAVEAQIAADLDLDWGRTSGRTGALAIATAQARVRELGRQVDELTQPVFESHGRRTFSQTRADSVKRLRLPITRQLADLDERLIRFIGESQTNFVTDEYGRRSVALSRRTRKIVATGMKEGVGRDQLTRTLAKDTKLLLTGRSKNYFDVVSRIYVNRGRTLSALSSYQDGGVKRYEFVATLDARTSSICRFMHGRTWEVEPELERFADATRLRDPERIRDLSPFVQEGKDGDGKPMLYIRQGDRRRRVAGIVESGVGRVGERGKYSGAMTNGELARAGVTVPPLH